MLTFFSFVGAAILGSSMHAVFWPLAQAGMPFLRSFAVIPSTFSVSMWMCVRPGGVVAEDSCNSMNVSLLSWK